MDTPIYLRIVVEGIDMVINESCDGRIRATASRGRWVDSVLIQGPFCGVPAEVQAHLYAGDDGSWWRFKWKQDDKRVVSVLADSQCFDVIRQGLVIRGCNLPPTDQWAELVDWTDEAMSKRGLE